MSTKKNEIMERNLETVCNMDAVSAISNKPLRDETLAFVKTLAEEATLLDTTATAIDALRKKQAPIIYRIQSAKLYEKGGYKNMSEYAASIGLSDKSKSLISGLFAVGKVMCDKTAPDALKDMSASKIAQMGTLVRNDTAYKAVKEDASAGKLDGMTLAQVKDYAASAKAASGEAKVVTTYNATIDGAESDHGADTLDGWKAYLTKTGAEWLNAPNAKATADADKATVKRAVLIDGNAAHLIVFAAVTTASKDGKTKTTKGVMPEEVAALGRIARKQASGETLTEYEENIARKFGMM